MHNMDVDTAWTRQKLEQFINVYKLQSPVL